MGICVRFDPTPDGMLAQLVERALSMCKVRSSTLLHSTIFFCCCGVGGVLRGAKNNNTASLIQRRQIYDEFKRERGAGGFFLRTNSFSYAKSPFYNCYNTTTSYVLLLCTIRVYFHLLLLLLVVFTLGIISLSRCTVRCSSCSKTPALRTQSRLDLFLRKTRNFSSNFPFVSPRTGRFCPTKPNASPRRS